MTRTLVTAIVSTAAEGAERGALAAAIELGIGYGGRTDAGELPPIYAWRTRSVDGRGMAVRLNTQDSDGTLIVSFADELTGRCKYAADTARQQRKPCQHLILPARGRTRITEAVRAGLLAWVDDRHVSVLHVVGPGEDLEPGIQQATQDALVWVLEDQTAVLDGQPTGAIWDGPATPVQDAVAEQHAAFDRAAEQYEELKLSVAHGDIVLDANGDVVPTVTIAQPEVKVRSARSRTITGPDGVPRWEFEDGERLDAATRTRPAAVAASIVARCQELVDRSTKPTLPEVSPLIDAYYALPGNGAGGELHIVLDDGNYERSSIEYCIASAEREETKALGAVLLLLSNSQRRRM